MADIGSTAGGAGTPAPIVLDFGQRGPRAMEAEGDALPHRHEIAFSGTGSEYFRLWIVNLLLIVVTLTLYYPWAKVRKLRYFHTNTHVAGHALDFHGEPLKMLRGYVLVVALAGAYALAGEVSPGAQTIALLLLALLWPALWRASLQFRLGNTSWRGLRLRFSGSLGGAYGALLLPWVVFAVVGGAIGFLAAVLGAAASRPEFVLLPLVMVAGVYGLIPYFWLRLKRYQHGHYAYGNLETALDTGVGATYGAFVRAAGVATLTFLVAGLAFLLAATLLGGASLAGSKAVAGAVLAFAPLVALLFILAQVVPRAYITARLQNLLWSGTGSADIRFESRLAFGSLARLLFKNWLLVIVTLGLYWPWAAIAVARLRLEAVSLSTRESLDALSAGVTPRRGDAAGDAAGDVFGIDLGL